MALTLRLALARECQVCLTLRDQDEFQADTFLIALAGVVDDPYAVCPACHHETPKEEREEEAYRQRVRVYYYGRGVVLRQEANGEWRKRLI
mgnify:CR=1 FL=1